MVYLILPTLFIHRADESREQAREAQDNSSSDEGSLQPLSILPLPKRFRMATSQEVAPPVVVGNAENRVRLKEKFLEEDEDELFGRMIAASLRRLSPRTKAVGKIQIQHLLFSLEFGTSSGLGSPPFT